VPADSGYAAAARREAHEILSRSPYTQTHHAPPRPLAGVLHAIGRGVDVVFGPVFRWLRRELVDPVGHGLSHVFGSFAPVVAIAVVVVAGVFLALLLIRRRARLSARGEPAMPTASTIDPSALEEEADRRAREGDFADAVRLRFDAGLRRLELAGLLTEPETRTGSEVVVRIGSPTFEGLAHQHEAIAYAAASAGPSDDERARLEWPAVPDEARRHRTLVESMSR
jgi:hypothetical protein